MIHTHRFSSFWWNWSRENKVSCWIFFKKLLRMRVVIFGRFCFRSSVELMSIWLMIWWWYFCGWLRAVLALEGRDCPWSRSFRWRVTDAFWPISYVTVACGYYATSTFGGGWTIVSWNSCSQLCFSYGFTCSHRSCWCWANSIIPTTPRSRPWERSSSLLAVGIEWGRRVFQARRWSNLLYKEIDCGRK